MDRLEVLKTLRDPGRNLRRRRGRRADRNRRRIDRFPAVCTPHALERAGLGVVHHHTTVAVSVRDEQLVRLRVHAQPRRAQQKLRRVASGLPALSDLHDKFSGLGELEDLAVLRHRVADHPHEPFRIDVKAVLVLRPFVRLQPPALSLVERAPALNEIAGVVELEHRRCGHRAQILGKRTRPMQHPHVSLRIDGNG